MSNWLYLIGSLFFVAGTVLNIYSAMNDARANDAAPHGNAQGVPGSERELRHAGGVPEAQGTDADGDGVGTDSPEWPYIIDSSSPDDLETWRRMHNFLNGFVENV